MLGLNNWGGGCMVAWMHGVLGRIKANYKLLTKKAPPGLSIRLIYSPQAFIGPKGAIPSFHFSNIPFFHHSWLE
jgi:hypothetical protein